MRLLDTKTGQFVDHDPHTGIYSILSHTWVPEGEQSYQDLRVIQRDYGPDGLPLPTAPSVSSSPIASTAPTSLLPNHHTPQYSSIWDDPRLSPKIRLACKTAANYGFHYIWIDSCCIDKMNSAEWSEAINSMFAWYRDAGLCFVFLADVPIGDPRQNPRFKISRWFTRGWTLQELLAPQEVVFVSEEWTYLGSKDSLASLLHEITGIEEDILRHQISLNHVSVATRMSWASNRETTRLEDEAYSLLGIFDIQMAPLYGEGRRAFRRLQEEILRRIPDQSLFAWGNARTCPVPAILDVGPCHASTTFRWGSASNGQREERPPLLSQTQMSSLSLMNTPSLFATSPRDFHGSNGVNPVNHDLFTVLLGGEIDVPMHDYAPSPYGIRTQFPLLLLANESPITSPSHDYYISILACTDEHHSSRSLLGRLCVIQHYESPSFKLDQIQLHAAVFQMELHGPCSLFVLPTTEALHAHNLLRHIRMRTVYLPHPDREPPQHELQGFEFKPPPQDPADNGCINVRFTEWAADSLRTQGYKVKVIPRATAGPRPRSTTIKLSKGADTITILYQYWINTHFDPRGELHFIANIYRDRAGLRTTRSWPWRPSRSSLQAHDLGSPSRGRSQYRHRVTKASGRPQAVFRRDPAGYSVWITRAAYHGERSLRDAALLPTVDGAGSAVVLEVQLDLVSSACYHLRLSIEGETPDEADGEEIATIDAGPGPAAEWKSGDNPFSLRTGLVRVRSLYPEDEEPVPSPCEV